jgi:hypothetical protein
MISIIRQASRMPASRPVSRGGACRKIEQCLPGKSQTRYAVWVQAREFAAPKLEAIRRREIAEADNTAVLADLEEAFNQARLASPQYVRHGGNAAAFRQAEEMNRHSERRLTAPIVLRRTGLAFLLRRRHRGSAVGEPRVTPRRRSNSFHRLRRGGSVRGRSARRAWAFRSARCCSRMNSSLAPRPAPLLPGSISALVPPRT